MFEKCDVVLSPNPLLNEVAHPIVQFDTSVQALAKQMLKTMYASNGVGLAANQVGVLQRMVVIDTWYTSKKDREPLVLINPEIIEHSTDTYLGPEGCLSIPGVSFDIERYSWVKVRAQNLNGEYFEIEAQQDELLCKCLQHEIDHINGITMFERMPPMQKMKAVSAYQDALARGAKPGDVE